MTEGASVSAQEQRGRRRARQARLVYVNDFSAGITRRRRGRGFSYISVSGRTIRSDRTRKRIDALAIPPAWEDVWICPTPTGHVQAVGRDARGRRQYLYHERWAAISAATKYDRMHLMASLLPRIRRRVRRDLNRRKLTRERVLAAVVRLIDRANLRVGNERYTEAHGSRGATTLSAEHVDMDGVQISLDFPGKSGQQREIEFRDGKVARVIRQCEDIDGQFLFCYRDEDGDYESVNSTEVNDYLREIADEPVTAKDFRTWSGSVEALAVLADGLYEGQTQRERKQVVRRAVAETAKLLGNTQAVSRKSYIHPAILAAAESGQLPELLERAEGRARRSRIPELTLDERRFALFLGDNPDVA